MIIWLVLHLFSCRKFLPLACTFPAIYATFIPEFSVICASVTSFENSNSSNTCFIRRNCVIWENSNEK